MSNLILGTALSGANGPVGGNGNDGPAIQITASLPPATAPLYDGQSLQETPDYAAMTAPGNFTSSAGPIAQVDLDIQGDVTSDSATLTENQIVGFRVTVTDTFGNTETFDAGTTTVQYRVRLETTDSNEARININPLVPDTTGIEISITGSAEFNGFYFATAGELRDGPVVLGGASLTGDTDLGATLTAADGLWTTPNGVLTLTRQWLRDGVAISGATGETYTLTSADQGSDIAVRITGDDGETPAVSTQSAPLAIPPGGPTVIELGSLQATSVSNISTIAETIDTGAAQAGKTLLVEAAWGDQSANSDQTLLGTLDGAAMTEQAHAANGRQNASILSFDVSSGGLYDLELSVLPGGVAWRGLSYRKWLVTNLNEIVPLTATGTVPAPLDLSAQVAAGDRIIGSVILANGGTTGGLDLTGLTLDAQSPSPNGNKEHYHVSAAPTSADPLRTMTVTATGDAAGAQAAAAVIIR